jgi:hypothetical protein
MALGGCILSPKLCAMFGLQWIYPRLQRVFGYTSKIGPRQLLVLLTTALVHVNVDLLIRARTSMEVGPHVRYRE